GSGRQRPYGNRQMAPREWRQPELPLRPWLLPVTYCRGQRPPRNRQASSSPWRRPTSRYQRRQIRPRLGLRTQSFRRSRLSSEHQHIDKSKLFEERNYGSNTAHFLIWIVSHARLPYDQCRVLHASSGNGSPDFGINQHGFCLWRNQPETAHLRWRRSLSSS